MMKKLLITSLLIFSLIGNCFAEGNDSNTVSLLHKDGADGATTFTDDAAGGTHTWTASGNAQIDTAQSKFGGASGLFDGTGDDIYSVDSNDWYFSTADFTVDLWVRFSDVTTNQSLVAQINSGDANIYWRCVYFGVDSLLALQCWNSGNKGYYYFTWTPSTNTWYHLAFERSGTGAFIFVDGVSQTLTTGAAFGTNDVGDSNGNARVGQWGDGTQYVSGWVDEVRISKGIARWTANFTPPTEAYSAVRRRMIIFE